MINAETAKANVISYHAQFIAKVQAVVDEILEAMGKSIEFHSKSGLTTAEFCPYASSRFPCDKAKEEAQKMFEKTFKEYGYTILVNNIEKNILKIQW